MIPWAGTGKYSVLTQTGAWIGLALIHLMPALAFFRPATLTRLYDMDAASPLFDAKASSEAPRWYAVDIRYEGRFPAVLTAQQLREEPALTELALLRQGRLSVSPVSDAQWLVLQSLLGPPAP